MLSDSGQCQWLDLSLLPYTIYPGDTIACWRPFSATTPCAT